MDLPVIFAAMGVLGIIAAAAFFVIGRNAGRALERRAQSAARGTAEETSKRILGDAQREADSLRKAVVVAGREEVIKLREQWEQEGAKRREEVERAERRLQERETALDRKYDLLEQREREVGRRASEVGRKEKSIGEREKELDRMLSEERRRLEQLAGMSADDAKAELMHRMEEAAQAEAANRLREIRESARRTAEREAKKIVALAVQRVGWDQTARISVASCARPNDAMKAPIIGRQRRNIRAFELATGVNTITDDTRNTAVV